MRGIAVPDDAGGRGTRLRSLRVDVLDLRHKAIRISADMRQVFPGEIGDLGKGGEQYSWLPLTAFFSPIRTTPVQTLRRRERNASLTKRV